MPPDYQAAAEGAAFFVLSDNAVIEAAGPDAQTFLHNLCTQDIKNLPVGAACEAFLTTNKARVVAHVWITHREPNTFWLDMAAGPTARVLDHLNRFLISEQVELADRTAEVALLRVVGPKSAALPVTPSRRHRLLGLDGFDVFCSPGEVSGLQQRLSAAGAVCADAAAYNILRIEAGLPQYGIDIDENRLAMEVNRPQAISYSKGCYLGQETIVMARDRGQVNRLMMGVKVSPTSTDTSFLPAGARVMRGNDEVGQVTSSVYSPRLGQVIALAYLKRGSWDAGTEIVIDGRPGVVCALPFC
jgi:folate-binding protein YgfZ